MPVIAPAAPEKAAEILYPSSDGEPMAETTIHIRAIMLLFQALEDFFQAAVDVFIGADLFWYWEEGNPRARRAPDVMVIKGVGQKERRSFFSWLEGGAVPHAIFEFASENTWREDLFEKHRLYAELGVSEYFIFDPEGAYLRPALQGFRLDSRGVYLPLEPDAQERLTSVELGLFLNAEGTMLRLIDAATGQPILTRKERIAQLQAMLDQKEARP